jgi:hypothetical protein
VQAQRFFSCTCRKAVVIVGVLVLVAAIRRQFEGEDEYIEEDDDGLPEPIAAGRT